MNWKWLVMIGGGFCGFSVFVGCLGLNVIIVSCLLLGDSENFFMLVGRCVIWCVLLLLVGIV